MHNTHTKLSLSRMLKLKIQKLLNVHLSRQ